MIFQKSEAFEFLRFVNAYKLFFVKKIIGMSFSIHNKRDTLTLNRGMGPIAIVVVKFALALSAMALGRLSALKRSKVKKYFYFLLTSLLF